MKPTSLLYRLAMTAGIAVLPTPTLREESVARKSNLARRLIAHGLKKLFLFAVLTLFGSTAMAKPLTFDTHSLGTQCFSASNMKVTYGRFVTNNCPKLARAKIPRDDLNLGGILGFPAFNGPLKIEWSALDGTNLLAVLDLAEIFKDRVVLHKEDPEQLEPTLPVISPPSIIVEVNDRTLTLYMDVFIGLLTDEPGHPRRSSRNRLVAYQKTF